MNYTQTLAYLYAQLPMFHRVGAAAYKANLDNTWALMDKLNYPYKKFKSVHVAGTNGKGSSSHLLASVLQSAGYKVGLYTSPHLKDFRERIKINGIVISEKEVIRFVENYKLFFEKINPSFFEWTVALAFNYFSEQQIDIAIIEVGLGGRLDSTNVITPEVSLITNIGLDHTHLLGNTLTQIAIEKAGIIKPNIPVVVSEVLLETKSVFLKKAKENNTLIAIGEEQINVILKQRTNYKQEIIVNGLDWKNFNLIIDLPGTYQQKNIAGVLLIIKELQQKGWKINNEQIAHGFANTKQQTGLMGRWQVINTNPLVIADTGHNKDGIQTVLENIQLTPHKKLHFVLGMVNDKDVSEILKLLPSKAVYYFCKPNIPRGLDTNILKQQAETVGLKGEMYDSVSSSLQAALAACNDEDLVFVGGSTFVVSEVV